MTEMEAPGSEYSFDKNLDLRLKAISAPQPTGLAKWTPMQILTLAIIVITIFVLLIGTSNRFFRPEVMEVSVVLGALGIWRFGWWFTHAIRAEVYARARWPGMRARAAAQMEKWEAQREAGTYPGPVPGEKKDAGHH